eukprot:SM000130S27116  [mRNA]  locus=s130:216772:219735:- [translate_table: standard]
MAGANGKERTARRRRGTAVGRAHAEEAEKGAASGTAAVPSGRERERQPGNGGEEEEEEEDKEPASSSDGTDDDPGGSSEQDLFVQESLCFEQAVIFVMLKLCCCDVLHLQEGQELIAVDVEFHDPAPPDFHGIKALLRNYLDDAPVWDLSGFADIIVAQRTVGSVVKTAGEDSPIGVISILSPERYREKQCMKDLQSFLRKKCGGKPEAAGLEALWAAGRPNVGLLVCERVLNAPADILPPLYQGLFDEVGWAIEDEPKPLRAFFRFEKYLILTRMYKELRKLVEPASRLKGKRLKREMEKAERDFVYIKPEDEIFHKLSSWSFSFPVRAEEQAAHHSRGLRQLQLVMVVEACKIPQFHVQLRALIHGS